MRTHSFACAQELSASELVPQPQAKKKALLLGVPLSMAAELGFEPRHTESESAVLPLHNSAILICSWRIERLRPKTRIFAYGEDTEGWFHAHFSFLAFGMRTQTYRVCRSGVRFEFRSAEDIPKLRNPRMARYRLCGMQSLLCYLYTIPLFSRTLILLRTFVLVYSST